MENNLWTYIRILIYITIIIIVSIFSINRIYLKCSFVENLGITCPACGATRATVSIVKGNILDAIGYNAFYSLVIFPSFVFFALEDVCVIVKRSIGKIPKLSLVELLFGGKL